MYLHPAVGQALSHLHSSFSLTEITSQPSFDMKLMTLQNWPYLCSRSGLYLWSGIRLEAGQRIVTLLLVGLTVRAQCTHIMEAGLTSGPVHHCSFSAQSKFGAGDEAETPAYKGRRLTASRVTSNSITAGKAAGIFFEDKSHFQRVLRLLKMLPLVLCYWFVPIHSSLQRLSLEMKIYRINSCLNRLFPVYELWLKHKKFI